MKKILSQLILLAGFCMFFSACFKDQQKKTYTIYRPVIKQKAEVLNEMNSAAVSVVQAPGKFYLYGKYIFLNEINKGVHVIDNGNPASPKKVAFLKIPGNLDIAVKGNTLYADFYSDLLALDISNPLQVKLTKMLPRSFPERQYANGYTPDSNTVVVDWIKKDTTVYGEEKPLYWQYDCRGCLYSGTAQNSAKSASGVPGVAGSMSRFTVAGDFLYTVNSSNLNTHTISNAANPEKINSMQLGWNIETLYPLKDKLFIGSATGMFIVDIANQSTPVLKGNFTHARACDPVVANDKFAYVTLRSGTICNSLVNNLDIVNVENVASPFLVKSYPFTNPHGLALDDQLLFICDGKDGLKILDVTYPSDIKPIHQIPVKDAYDVAVWNKVLYLVSADGLYQYDYSNINQIKLLSKIVVNRN
jgi:hypothetical protein